MKDEAYSRAVRFLPRMCQYMHRSPHICRPSSQAAASPDRAAARRVSSAAWRFPSSAMPRSTEPTWSVPAMPLADLSARAPRIGARASARSHGLARGVESFACVLADRLQHPEPVAWRPPGRAPCRRATPARRGRSRRSRRRPPRRRRVCTRPRRRPCAGTGAARIPRGASGSSRSWRAASAAARACRGSRM